ncbi:non-ribosomal peptide synthetase, partial [Pseudoalteromonas aurantia]
MKSDNGTNINNNSPANAVSANTNMGTDFDLANDSVIDAFDHIASLYSEKVAIQSSDKRHTITYHALATLSDNMAQALVREGICSGQSVGICLTRSIEQICLALAILKAGGVYVPLDKDYPQERLTSMCQTSDIQLIISDTDIKFGSIKTIPLERFTHSLSAPIESPLPARSPKSPAYTIFTSGSTGQPKGVIVPDQAILRLVQQNNELAIYPNDIVLHQANIVFDASIYEIWGALLRGATLVLSTQDRVSIRTLAEDIANNDISVLWLTGTLFHIVADQDVKVLSSLRLLVVGGEVISPERVSRFLALDGNQTLINGYGPTEATTFSTYYAVNQWTKSDTEQADGTFPIGYALDNTCTYILDENLNEVSVGESGQLFIGGLGLALGYMNDQTTTDAKFISLGTGEKLYATGDKVKCLADGRIVYLGRIDDQVKVRGFRIELGEIENAINNLADVTQCCVVVRENQVQKQLVAFYCSDSHEVVDIKTQIQHSLPKYMFPHFFQKVSEWPTTINGKVDKKSLIAMLDEKPAAFLEKQNDLHLNTESDLINIWQEVLGLETVGIKDNFFELGGDSILCIQVAGLAEQQGYQIDIGVIFDNPTIERLAQYLSAKQPITESVNDKRNEDDLVAALKDIWKEVLSVENISIEDDFFQLGGDSILCIQVAGLAEVHGFKIEIGEIFDNPTIKTLANHLGSVTTVEHIEPIDTLRKIWQSVLGLDYINEEDDFFDLGGDSLLCVQVAGLAELEGFNFSVADMFEYSKLKELANTYDSDLLADEDIEHSNVAVNYKELPLPEGVSAIYPAAQAQVGMLYHSDIEQGSGIYHDVLSHTINLPFIERDFTAALEMVIEKHEILRSAFDINQYETAMQLVYDEIVPEVEIAVEKRDVEQQRNLHQQWVEQEIVRDFEWQRAGLFRVKVFVFNDDSFVLGLSFHHAILDGWSASNLISDLALLLDPAQGLEQFNRQLACSYQDYIELEQQALTSASSRDYWINKLEDADKTEIMPLRVAHGCGTERISVELDPGKTQSLSLIARELGVTLKTVFMAVHLRAMSLLSGKRDVITGLVTNGRPEALDGDKIVGMFINTLAFRTTVSDVSWKELITQVARQEYELLKHRRYPLAAMKSDLRGAELFDVLFNFTHFRNYEKKQQNGQYLVQRGAFAQPLSDEDDLLALDHESSNFTMTIQAGLLPDNSRAYFVIEADASKYNQEDRARFASIYNAQISALLANPEASCQFTAERSALTHQLVIPEDLNNITNQWHREHINYGIARGIHQTVELQAQRSPNAVALTTSNESITYEELNCRANRLAHLLRARFENEFAKEMPRESLVLLYLESGVDQIISTLAVLKAGGAYVPINTDVPESRVVHIFEDTAAKLVITNDAHQDQVEGIIFNSDYQCELVVCDDAHALSTQPEYDLSLSYNVNDLAYVIYTSGTTGMPKGVLQTHQNVMRLFSATEQEYRFSEQDVWLLYHAYTFDFSVWEMWGALLHGGRLVIPQSEVVRDFPQVVKLCQQESITVLNQTPGAFQGFSAAALAERAQLPALRYVIFGGDKLNPASLQGWWSHYGDTQPQFVNMYGITETTVHTTYHQLNVANASELSTIGRVLPDMQAYILNEHLELVAPGVPGELYIGGAGLARGYLNREKLTAERFIENPFADKQMKALGHERMYKTGDVVRWIDNGEIEYLGRNDNQIKVRGYRIELGEIEAALLGQVNIKQAIVVTEAEGGHARILAYIVSDSISVDTNEIQVTLSKLLPSYMLPAHIVQIDTVPLTSNGKLNRAALPKPTMGGNDAYVAPSTELEVQLCDIWQQVLKVDRVGVQDSYFELGGDSILSIQVSAKAKAQGIEFSLMDLMHSKTISCLAAIISSGETSSAITASSTAFSLLQPEDKLSLPREVIDAYPVSQTQLGMLYHSDREREESAYHDIMTHTIRMPYQAEAFKQAFIALIERHEILRTAFNIGEYSEPLQLVYGQVNSSFDTQDQLGWSTEARQQSLDEWFANEKAMGLNWQSVGVFRTKVFVHDENAFIFGFSFHHALLDGWSVSVLMSDLVSLYEASLAGQQADLPDIDTCYREYIALEQSELNSDLAKNFWHNIVADIEPVDIPGHAISESKSSISRFDVPVSESEATLVKAFAASLGVSLKSVLLAVHLRALHALSGQSKLVTGMVTNGRPEAVGGEQLLGLFLNSLPFSTTT